MSEDKKAAAGVKKGKPKSRRKAAAANVVSGDGAGPVSGADQVKALKEFSVLAGVGSPNGVYIRKIISQPFEAKTAAAALEIWRLNTTQPHYLAPADGGDWRRMSTGDLARYLKIQGVKLKPEDEMRFSQAELLLEYVQNFRLVDFAGPLAGHKAGVKMFNGKPIIISSGPPRLREPKEGDWSLIRAVLEPRLADDAGPQLDLFFLWAKRFIEPLYAGRRRKGPLLILAGPNDAGKTVIQHLIITELFGGREADPTDYLKSEQGFNKSVMGSEHLAMSEFPFGLDGASRLLLSEKLKRIVANDVHSYHPKGLDPIFLEPCFRLSIAVNDTSEKLRALPPMTIDLVDKVLLLKVRGGLPMPMPTNTDLEEKEFAEALTAQIPAFAHHLLNWEPPAEMATGRFGMKTWQHPEIVEMLWEQEPVSRFAFLLDRCLFPETEKLAWDAWGWRSAAELHEQLTAEDCGYHAQFRSLLKYEGACSQMLGHLHKREAEQLAQARGVRVQQIEECADGRRYLKKHTNAGNVWMLKPPRSPGDLSPVPSN